MRWRNDAGDNSQMMQRYTAARIKHQEGDRDMSSAASSCLSRSRQGCSAVFALLCLA